MVRNKQPELDEKELMQELDGHYRDCDKLLFLSQLYALNVELPEEFQTDEFKVPNAFAEIIGFVKQMEPMIKAPDSPLAVLGYDLKSYAIMMVMALCFPEAKEKVVEQLMVVYNLGKKDEHKNRRFYSTNWDRCVKFKTQHNYARKNLPAFSTLLEHVLNHPGNLESGPILAIRSLVDLSSVELTDLGTEYRDKLYTEEVEGEDMAKKKQARTIQAAQQKVEQAQATTQTLVANNEATKAELKANIEELNLTTDAKSADDIKDEFVEELQKEVNEMAKDTPSTKAHDAEEAVKAAQKAFEEAQAALDGVKELKFDFSNLKPEDIVSRESWSEEKPMSTTKKVLLGLGGLLLVGGIGYGIYEATRGGKAAFDTGLDRV